MMALNRYRLKHLSNEGHGGASRANKLLERPDRLLGVILIGNNLANFTAASLATVLAIKLLGDDGIAAAPIICTIVFLVFAEVAPKTRRRSLPGKGSTPFFLPPAITSMGLLSVCLAGEHYGEWVPEVVWCQSRRCR